MIFVYICEIILSYVSNVVQIMLKNVLEENKDYCQTARQTTALKQAWSLILLSPDHYKSL